ncbi:hypothetical protein CXB40_03710 [Pseudomonas syringae pv. avii]|uniref:Uncharacterized protein n=6 Tax=Pseudomonas syringae group TaxID=136849 RepID=A0A0Q0I0U3_PSESX|nr:hypothetical protein PSPTO_4785 [Pseudomonas syringae pv. tomato str. DC3000]KPW27632.1 Uncharacterized protein ALO87_05563 [Pseudomonas syringae pv. apii]KPW49831.1 Uncharacterized protein ALO86_05258 [Pseudomonas syringae pv. berberidis]KPX70973.1 Uncharacterized protein ALO84_04617 [Pseudomonas syringae pv. maculicola]KPY27309.1 Uncharacterized protein ALO54_05307 [Pseudomonas syringae pv. philadelphi]KPY94621.1 Uncharacterized protein ALO94_05230 [Pseudomonas syringae pv. spinaceae]KPZ
MARLPYCRGVKLQHLILLTHNRPDYPTSGFIYSIET